MSNQFGKKGWTPDRIDNLDGKTFLITGANTGAGFEAAKKVLAGGGTVQFQGATGSMRFDTNRDVTAPSRDLGVLGQWHDRG